MPTSPASTPANGPNAAPPSASPIVVAVPSPAVPSPVVSAVSKPAAPVPADVTAPAPAAMAERHTLRVVGYAALGAGVVGEGLALLFHGSAQSAANEFNQKHAAGTLTSSDASLKSDAESKGRLATVAALGGVLLLATGGLLSFAF